MLYYFILGGAFLTVVFMMLGLYQLKHGSRFAVLERLNGGTAEQVGDINGQEYFRGRGLWREVLHVFGTLGNTLSPQRKLPAVQKKLIQAHILMRAEELVGLSIVAALFVFLIIYLLANIFSALPAGLIALKLPGIIVDIKKKKRMESLTGQLPEALDLITSGLRAGFSFPQAIAVVNKEMTPPITEEFSRVLRENSMGKTMDEVLHDLGDRTDSEDLDLVITALLIQKQVGGNLAEILDSISHTIRERVRISGEIRTLTAQGRMSALIIILLPLALAAFLFVFNPDYIMLLFQDTIGIFMISGAVVLQIMGIMLIRKIIDIDI